MHIVFINRYFHPDHSATSQILSDLAFALRKDNYDVTVIASRQRYDSPGADLPAFETINGVEVHRVLTTKLGRANLLGRMLDYLSFYISAAFKLHALTRSRTTVVIPMTDPPMLSVAVQAISKLNKFPHINWVQDLFPDTAQRLNIPGTRGLLGNTLQKLHNKAIRQSACSVVIDAGMQKILTSRGIPQGQLALIPNWANGKLIGPIPSDENHLRQSWGLDGKFVIGYSGNLGRAHEYQTMLDAAVRLADTRNICFLVIGGGALLPKLKRAVADNNLKNVIFKPYQPTDLLPYTLSLPDIHLVITRPDMEGLVFPSKFYAAIAAGRPCIYIGSKSAPIIEYLNNTDIGLAVESGDGSGLAESISGLLQSGSLQTMGENARAAFEKDFDFPVAYTAWKKLLQEQTGQGN